METDYDTDEMETDDSTPLSLTTLPSELLLGCCSFLDAWGLGRLELCARSSLGEEEADDRLGDSLRAELRYSCHGPRSAPAKSQCCSAGRC